ncbi:uncharacterized protein BDR25DRAFT_351490 [Lindgomyces ingoldianus]|uniref:Uncharacterized protein n=1 Tax=Lindgomyces ingoldianus TaxID=673940 RepID=A0ACB6R6W8_9PLEO|nr:uncharacterized protein BDR25DRAFT_351490 [Lindgomyces ingoldianus]KAF2475004.1 hypothetical protein BDR25DRAFT_351490 [Lindgomyces ingoldianus]
MSPQPSGNTEESSTASFYICSEKALSRFNAKRNLLKAQTHQFVVECFVRRYSTRMSTQYPYLGRFNKLAQFYLRLKIRREGSMSEKNCSEDILQILVHQQAAQNCSNGGHSRLFGRTIQLGCDTLTIMRQNLTEERTGVGALAMKRLSYPRYGFLWEVFRLLQPVVIFVLVIPSYSPQLTNTRPLEPLPSYNPAPTEKGGITFMQDFVSGLPGFIGGEEVISPRGLGAANREGIQIS